MQPSPDPTLLLSKQVVLKVLSSDQQPKHYAGPCYKGKLSEAILRRPTESETLGMGCRELGSTSSPEDYNVCSSLRSSDLRIAEVCCFFSVVAVVLKEMKKVGHSPTEMS